ncbi:voltage-gated chloride channel [Coprinopsis marcescibilis]|uniref:Chloride channel protein n=1 Tax=Coprinopsis marcescibilis TaxID=230819 RepID=A0A5C3KZG1_COPMA|nr:voltage-gated chloride channel [Coprinopsis marcescibilis]
MPQASEPSDGRGSGAPMSRQVRRERLFRVSSVANVRPNGTQEEPTADGNSESTRLAPGVPPTEQTSLNVNDTLNYGAALSQRPRLEARIPSNTYGGSKLSLRQPLRGLFQRATSSPQESIFTPASLRGGFAKLQSARPLSAYDPPLSSKDPEQVGQDAKINGIRVWYSSYTSIDWLHDAIKDSLRFSRLRRRKSIRARLRLAFDKSLGWIIVTIVGFLSAIVAFLVVRSEQLLFDYKEGYCEAGWWKAKRFCCPVTTGGRSPSDVSEVCEAWNEWSEVWKVHEGHHATAVEYASYTAIALALSLTSCLLTIYLTNSTTFVTRKESAVVPDPWDPKNPSENPPGRKVLYYAAGSGIPEIKTILSGFVIHGYLGVRVLFTKSVGLALSVASGLSLGKEGPFVHIASCVGNIVSRIASKYELNEAKRREILSAACAAGVAVAFGAPIGGTLFSLEEVSYFFPPKVMWRSFFCAMIAAITLKMLDPFGTGKLVLFQVTYDKDWHSYELVPFVFLGLFGGVYGAYFSKLNYRWSKNVRGKTWVGKHPIIEVLAITFITSCFCFLNPYTRMGGTELVYNLFSECRPGKSHSGLCVASPGSFEHAWPIAKAILIAMVVKGALTIVTFGIKVPAGIFIPTLGVGACAGRVTGILMQYLQARHPNARMFEACNGDLDCIVPGLYAMVGAAAALSGVTRTTVSLAVIMFELTDTLTYAVPVMLSVLVAKTVADALEPKGIYDLVIELSQLPYLDYKSDYVWGHLQIPDVISKEIPSIRVDEKNTVQSLSDRLIDLISTGAHDMGFPILRPDAHDEGTRLVGYIGANELEHALSIVADDPMAEIHFGAPYTSDMASSVSSLAEPAVVHPNASDPYDFTPYMDQAPLTLTIHSPLEMLHRFFVKLGARYVVVVDSDGLYEGIIEKKNWLAFLSEFKEE